MTASAPLLIDARPVDHPTARQRGIGRYVTGLLTGLVQAEIDHVALVGSRIEAEVLTEAVAGIRCEWWHPETLRRVLAQTPGVAPWYLATQAMLHPLTLDPVPRLITEAGLDVAAVMYDVIPHRHPERYLVDPAARRLAQIRAPLVRTCDALLAISDFAADTAAVTLGFDRDRIATIGAGVEDRFTPAPPGSDPRSHVEHLFTAEVVRRRPRLVVAVTGGDERKNTEGLLRAWGRLDAEFRRGHHLVVAAALAPSVRERWERIATDQGVVLGSEVTFTGGISDEELVALLQSATLGVMASLEEGFGLPVLEAVACGAPAICSRVSSLPEVLDEPAATFDPHQPTAIAAAIRAACQDPEHRDRLVAAGDRAAKRWRWDRVARDTVEALARLGPRHPRRRRNPPRRVALVGPFEGSGSGIGTYDTAWSQAVSAREDVLAGELILDTFVDTSASSLPTRDTVTGRGPGSRRLPAGALGTTVPGHLYDAVVIALGSSPHHLASLGVARRLLDTGTRVYLWFHEASLVGAEVGLAHASGSSTWARDHVATQIAKNESASTRAALEGADLLDPEVLHRAGVTLVGDLARRAAGLIVSSTEAAAVLEAAIRGLGSTPPPILVVPLAHRDLPDPEVGERSEDETDAVRVVSVGWWAPNKAPEIVLDAFATARERLLASSQESIRRRGRVAELVVIGPVHAGSDAVLLDAASARGLADRVRLTGRVDDDTYRRLLASARVAIQLRHDATGQASAAITDLLAAGVPTVTNLAAAPTPAGGSLDGGRLIVPVAAPAVADALSAMLVDDDAWRRERALARATASSWGFADLAASVLDWIMTSDRWGPRALGS